MPFESIAILEAALHLNEVHDPCPYLSDKISTLNVCHGLQPAELYRAFLDMGYRRNGLVMYRPICKHCTACNVLRVPVQAFKRSKEQRRIWNRGKRLFRVTLDSPAFTPEKLLLYRRYLAYQHHDAGTGFGAEKYQEFLVDSFLGASTREIQVYTGDTLAGVGIFDLAGDALSTVYFYFNPAFARYSPGTWSALYELDLAKQWGLDYYYFGYYIEACPAMNYKLRFRPCEIKTPDGVDWELHSR